MAVYEIDIKNLSRLKAMIKDMNETVSSLKEVNKELDEVSKTSKKASQSTKEFKEFNSELSNINNNIFKMFAVDEVLDHFGKLKKMGRTFFKSLTAGSLSFIKTIGILIGKLAVVTIVITAIMSIVKLLKTAFKFNIGGIQSSFRKMQGQFKQLAATLKLLFFNYLKKLAPVFEAIGKALEEVMKVLMSKEVLDAFMIITDVFGTLLKAILPALVSIIKFLAKLIQGMAAGIKGVAGFLGHSGSSTTNNSSTSNDNRVNNYTYNNSIHGASPDLMRQINYSN